MAYSVNLVAQMALKIESDFRRKQRHFIMLAELLTFQCVHLKDWQLTQETWSIIPFWLTPDFRRALKLILNFLSKQI